MKRVAAVRIAFTLRGTYRVPSTETSYTCRISTDEIAGIDTELDEAVNQAIGVTWTLENRNGGWEGSIDGVDPEQLGGVRSYLLDKMGWKTSEDATKNDGRDAW